MALLALGGVSVAVAIGGLIFAGGGVIFLPLALPLLAAGCMVVRAMPGARVVGLLVSVLYGGFVWSFATYPLRGLTPPPGQADTRQIDVGSALIACAFLAAAIMILVGSGRREPSSGR
jgi:hypothetical protein